MENKEDTNISFKPENFEEVETIAINWYNLYLHNSRRNIELNKKFSWQADLFRSGLLLNPFLEKHLLKIKSISLCYELIIELFDLF